MSLNKTLLALALGLVLTAGGCKPASPAGTVYAETKPADAGEVEKTDIDSYTVRFYDRKHNVVCYKYYSYGISCVKL